ncbi:MAG: ABC transporter ATP-binding protein [Arcobacter sp.]|nr:ABC transporter ATP-binding protein [Arcobacter sp.]
MLKIDNIYKSFSKDSHPLQGASLHIKKGEVVALMGPSGSGKSTLLNCITAIEDFDKGNVTLNGEDIDYSNKKRVCLLRKNEIGIIFQQFLLLEHLTVFEQLFFTSNKSKQSIVNCLKQLNLDNEIDKKIEYCSGGQQQRVAIARALVKKPKLLLADEPTANLDASLAIKSLQLMIQIAKENETAVLIVTHDTRITPLCDRIVYMSDGVIKDDI